MGKKPISQWLDFYETPDSRMIINPFIFSGGTSYDPDADAWFAALVTAGSSITDPNKAAISAFVAGCKADDSLTGGVSNWAAMKVALMLCAADDLTGGLVSLIGATPTNSNFVSGDYSRTLGLQGNGSTKRLSLNRANNADPQDNASIGVYVTGAATLTNGHYIAADTSANRLYFQTTPRTGFQIRGNGGFVNTASATGLIGASRISSTGITRRISGSDSSATVTSVAPNTAIWSLFSTPAAGSFSDARISFAWVGEAVDLALLDARLVTLMAALT